MHPCMLELKFVISSITLASIVVRPVTNDEKLGGAWEWDYHTAEMCILSRLPQQTLSRLP